MGEGLHTPWGEQKITERCARVKDECHSPRTAREADLDAPSIAPPGDGGVSNCVGGAEVARRSHKPEVAGSNPAPATTLSDDALLFLRLIMAHENCDMAAAIERAATLYCNSIIGLQRLADLREGDGA